MVAKNRLIKMAVRQLRIAMMQRPGVLDVPSHINDPVSNIFKNFFIKVLVDSLASRDNLLVNSFSRCQRDKSGCF